MGRMSYPVYSESNIMQNKSNIIVEKSRNREYNDNSLTEVKLAN